MKVLWLLWLLVGCAALPPEQPLTSPAPAPERTPQQSAEGEDAPVTRKLACSLEAESRTIIVSRNTDGCAVTYQTNGEGAVVASATRDPTHCERVAQKIQGNLTKAGFRCAP